MLLGYVTFVVQLERISIDDVVHGLLWFQLVIDLCFQGDLFPLRIVHSKLYQQLLQVFLF